MSMQAPFKWTRLVLQTTAVLAFSSVALAQGTLKIGEINSYKAQPAFLEPYKKGMELAVEQINAAGGLNGKKVQLITRDDNANPGDAVRVAEELISRDKVDVLTGSFLSHIGLALTDFAKQKKVFFLASEPLTDKIVWQNGNRYTFRLRTSTYMQVAMLVPEAAAMNKKRWAIVYPNYEYGQSAAATFKALLKAAQPDVEFVAEQAPPLGKLDAGSVVQALSDAKPDAIFNVYILLTDSNFPDMLFPYWRVTNTAAIFYVAYLCIGMFMLLNLLLAVFFNNYKQIIEMKIRKFDDSRLEFLAKEFAKCRE